MRKISKFIIATVATAAIPVLAVDEFILSSPGSKLRFQTQSGTEVVITCEPRTRNGRTMADLEAEMRVLTNQLAANRRQSSRRDNDDYNC